MGLRKPQATPRVRGAEGRGLNRSEGRVGPPNGLEEATGARSLLFLRTAGGEKGRGATPSRTRARQVGHVVQCLSTAGLLIRGAIYSLSFLRASPWRLIPNRSLMVMFARLRWGVTQVNKLSRLRPAACLPTITFPAEIQLSAGTRRCGSGLRRANICHKRATYVSASWQTGDCAHKHHINRKMQYEEVY